MNIRIFGTVEDSIVDGTGLRFTVFVQGCPHHCPGCHNPASHDFNGGTLMDTVDIVKKLTANPLLDGLTLSGGEPMCQAEACIRLARAAKGLGMNVWCYTGYTWEELMEENDPKRMELLKLVDVLVDGRFLLKERSLELRFRGSRNQRVIDVQESFKQGHAIEWRFDV